MPPYNKHSGKPHLDFVLTIFSLTRNGNILCALKCYFIDPNDKYLAVYKYTVLNTQNEENLTQQR